MKQIFTDTLITTGIIIIIMRILLPLLIRVSPKLKLVDLPNERKLHRKPIPAIGGMVLVISLLITATLSPVLAGLLKTFATLTACLLIMCVTGVLDDRLNMPALLRLFIQIACSAAVAYSGIRLHSLYGMFGIQELPLFVQYALTILIVTGVTNAFNLIDGIDGLAGGLALINVITLSIMAVWLKNYQWIVLLMPLAGGLMVFLFFNWRPAKVFMGDGGSLVLGFLMAAAGLALLPAPDGKDVDIQPATSAAMITAYCMIPVMDTLRVFYARIQRGRSPFSADKNHLHHWLIRHHLVHSQATGRLIVFHVMLIAGSALAIQFIHTTWVLFLEVLSVILYTKMLQILTWFYRWYRFVKRMETVQVSEK